VLETGYSFSVPENITQDGSGGLPISGFRAATIW